MLRSLLLLGCVSIIWAVDLSSLPDSSSSSTHSSSSSPLSSKDEWSHFTHFQAQFGKVYATIAEMTHRFEIFCTNLRTILSHNSDDTATYRLGINQFADMTPEEFKTQFIGKSSKYMNLKMKTAQSQSQSQSTKTKTNTKTKTTTSCSTFVGTKRIVPLSFDWRDYNAVSPVKDQGQCGSCWSFSSSGAMEGAWAISSGKLVSISEQQLVDCSVKYGNNGCNGGLMDNAFFYAIDNGMCAEAAYPYTHTDGNPCKNCSVVARFSGCADVVANNQLVLREAVATAPVSIAIEADTKYFQFYSSGVLTDNDCGTNLDHGVLIVGYGTDVGTNTPYWIVKNSWGATWGENGYVRIKRSLLTDDAGVCGIAMSASFILGQRNLQ
jgi:C1A family cysteine protease